MIELKNINLYYGKKHVLKDISLELADQGFTSIIGPNGSGKSSCLSILSRLLAPSSGSVSLAGKAVQKYSATEFAKQLSILQQSNHTNTRISIKELVMFGRYPYHQGSPTANDIKKVDECLDYLDLRELQNSFLDQLSGGQCQRAYIAMVLAQDTQYILLDEPLNHLDIKHSVGLMKLLRRLSDNMHKHIIMVLHDINFAAHYSDNIIALKSGKLAAQGTIDNMMQNETLSHIYDMPMEVTSINGKLTCMYYS